MELRVKTNVDLSTVRINGVKYYAQDLESKLFAPERNNILAETYLNYVSDKKTVVFCASVRHANEISSLYKDGYSNKDVERNIFMNPFKRFEDMRFMSQCRDIEYVEFNRHVWKRLEVEEKALLSQYPEIAKPNN